MKTEYFLDLIKNRKGQFVKLNWRRSVRTAATFKHHSIQKETTVVCRTGIEYDNMKSTQEKRATGELPPVNQGLQWGTWKEYPFVIEHNGQDYARIYAAVNSKPERRYYKDGEEINRKEYLLYLTPSDVKKELSNERSFFFDEQKAVAYYKECADNIIAEAEATIERFKIKKERIRVHIHPSELIKFEGDPLF